MKARLLLVDVMLLTGGECDIACGGDPTKFCGSTGEAGAISYTQETSSSTNSLVVTVLDQANNDVEGQTLPTGTVSQ